jgi:uncharacterized protein (DUF305 family)
MFAQMMIPHHEQALEMSVLALEQSTNASILDLAQRIFDGHGPEIKQMRGWLDSSPNMGGMSHQMPDGAMMDNHMMGSNSMAGMASTEDLAELASLTSPEFDRFFLRLMIDHHDGALAMVRMIENSPNDEVRALAGEIDKVQRAEIAEMTAYLASTDWYATRLAETGKPIPEEILKCRQGARDWISEMKKQEAHA